MRLKFDARLYTRKAVEEAAQAYADVARLTVSEEDGFIVVHGASADIEVEKNLLADEFSNFVLGAMRP